MFYDEQSLVIFLDELACTCGKAKLADEIIVVSMYLKFLTLWAVLSLVLVCG